MISLLRNLIPDSSEHVTIELREVVKDCDIFDRCDPFPIWDENHRGELEKKIIEHYYFRQIGFETVGRFKFYLNQRLREIMPYYIKLWETTQYKYNPIHNYNMEEESKDNKTSHTKNTSESANKYSETPPNELNKVKEGEYLTTATFDDSQHINDYNTEDKHTASRKGNIGVTSTQTLIKQERELIIDLDVKIIGQLRDLFIGVY